MDGFGFGAVGGLFGSSPSFSTFNSDPVPVDTKPFPEFRRRLTSDGMEEWDSNDAVNDFGFQKSVKRGVSTSSPAQGIVPIDVNLLKSSVKSALEAKSTSLTLYGQLITNVCITGRISDINELPSMIVMVLEDEWGKVNIRTGRNASSNPSDGNLVNVVGAVIILSEEDYYIDATHIRIVDDIFQEYHKVAVKFAAYSLDAATRLHSTSNSKLQSTVLIDKESWKHVKLGVEYDFITNPVEIAVIKFLTTQNDKIASIAVVTKSLADYQEQEIKEAIDSLVKQSEVGISGQLCFLP
ncbi:hypothetical protein BMR1_03g02705 [Babesia microti strain RI]|uniref:Uncharacterized protein n=1 Tax=Babesia microti (strain RI) TaxID=1133968 RepID=A0A0K3AU70_BABMR|nr:hypothetical protein BMR1_03g02705 [Babesia microti strain RI]CTQ41141.1 hypothetical protein BMR1_03g02705 [Babesia microti strain RI]|eukprot:XP_012649152.1 hypothetical protein BMR1_03g02705 [Babesia microti strain RI]